MKKLKKDFPRLTFRPSEVLDKKFRKQCFDLRLSHDLVMIELTNLWVNGKVRIPGQKKGRK